jgi:hypothetical protein
MALTDVVLLRGKMLVTLTTTASGIYATSDALTFGTVAFVCELSDNIAVGNTVMFDINGKRTFAHGSTIYYEVDESEVSLVEVTPP